MEELKTFLAELMQHFEKRAQGNAVVGATLSVGDRHIIPLCEIGFAMSGGGGGGEGAGDNGEVGKGIGMGGGGGAKTSPVAVIVVDGDKVRLETLGNK
jgi:uncharacterized spore protein YtfJ